MINFFNRAGQKIDTGKKVMWNPAYRVIKITPNELLLTTGLRSSFTYSVKDSKDLNLLDKIADLLRRPISFEELFRAFPSEHASYLSESLLPLYEEGIIVNKDESVLPFYQYQFKGLIEQRQVALGIIGAGPVGVRVGISLVDLGVCSSVTFADERSYSAEASELVKFPWFVRNGSHRQNVKYSDVAQKCLQQGVLRETERSVHALTALDRDTLKQLFGVASLVVVAMETYHPRLFADINTVALDLRKPVMYCFVDGGIAFVGPFVVPGDTACYMCFESLFESNILAQSTLLSLRSFIEEVEMNNGVPRIGGMPPLYDVIVGFVVDGIVRYLFQPSASPFIDRLLCIDFESMEIKVEDVLKNPNCPACSELLAPQTAPIVR